MSIYAISLLIDSGLITSLGKPVDLSRLPREEITERISQYINGRKQTIDSEVASFERLSSLNALFGSESTDVSKSKILPSALIYQSIIIDDPFVSAGSTITYDRINKGLSLFSEYFNLIKADIVKILPLSFFNRPSDDIPFLISDDAFKSCIPNELHDFIHERARLSSVVEDGLGNMMVLNEAASIRRRPALNVGFSGDYWRNGVSLYRFQTMENVETIGDSIMFTQVWEPEKLLDKATFELWSYQSINQAMRVRLKNIFNETTFANKLGYTYITESGFESELLSLSATQEHSCIDRPCKFLDANKALINIESSETVIELRDKYSNAIESFNSSVLYAAERLRDVDPDQFEIKAQLYFKNEILPHIDELRRNARSIGRSAAKGALTSLGGITAAIMSGSSLPLIPSLILVATNSVSESIDSVGRHQDYKKTPVYIWHRITKRG